LEPSSSYSLVFFLECSKRGNGRVSLFSPLPSGKTTQHYAFSPLPAREKEALKSPPRPPSRISSSRGNPSPLTFPFFFPFLGKLQGLRRSQPFLFSRLEANGTVPISFNSSLKLLRLVGYCANCTPPPFFPSPVEQ